jgi:hypothetical protein
MIQMQVKNQFVVISGILALLATATIAAASYIAQPANAACGDPGPYGRSCISQEAGPSFGPGVSGLAQSNNAAGGNGVSDGQYGRSSGCGFNQFPTTNGAHDNC